MILRDMDNMLATYGTVDLSVKGRGRGVSILLGGRKIDNSFAEVNFFVNFAIELIAIEFMAKREIKFYKHYFNEFFVAQSDKVRRKIAQTLVWIQTIDRLPVSILKSIEGKKGLYEIRVEYAGNIYRVFCCFDEGSLVILFNGFQKKTQKTPTSEIDKAERLMKEYFNNK